MRVIFVMFDSLNRHALAPYGGSAVPTPNFDRLAARAVTFDGHHVGSLPCMPARRDLHTGRLNFLHRSWGPLEPYDDSFTEILHRSGVYSHLVTDHYHYWEDGGATYHNRYDTFELIRGQERDPWWPLVDPDWDRIAPRYHPVQRMTKRRGKQTQNLINREFMGRAEGDWTSVQCFDKGLQFLDINRAADGWFLQIETFDPHEPFTAPERYREGLESGYDGPVLDWPEYKRVTETMEERAELRANYLALLALCDAQLGRILDYFDAHGLWENTVLVVSTDHGYLLGEHDWWAKLRMPCYSELAHIPLFIAHPAHRDRAGERRSALTQTIDLMPTFLDCFGIAPPADVEGHSLLPVLDEDRTLRDHALFGIFGGATNITDGRYTYFRYPPDIRRQTIFNYTQMCTNIVSRFSTGELAEAELAGPFAFSKGTRMLKVPALPDHPGSGRYLEPGFFQDAATVLYDLKDDPGQTRPVDDPEREATLAAAMVRLMRDNDAPPEAYERLALKVPA